MLVDSAWLFEQITNENQEIRIIDCRFDLSNASAGRTLYHEGHIPGAVHFDLEKDLSGEVQLHGGRHPLPSLKSFGAQLECYGISKHHILVMYDGGEYAFAMRMAWMMKYVGHEQVFILNGGFLNWQKQRLPVTKEIPHYPKSVYEICMDASILATYEEVHAVVENKQDAILIDSREHNRFLGVEEKIDKKAGHIPTAINFPFTEGIQNGFFLSANKQAERFPKWEKHQPLIVYCGSGVTATPNYFALKVAGYSNVKVYIGSFSDWISYDENEVATGKAHL